MALEPELLEVLACPKTHGPLVYFEAEGFLLSPEAGLKYPVVDDIPQLLEEAALPVGEDEIAALMAGRRPGNAG